MYVTAVPNRSSPPAILLRESYREGGKVRTRTIANISHLRPAQIEALRSALSGTVSPTGLALPDSFRIDRSRPHGHVAAVLGCLRQLQIDSILDPAPSRQRDLVIAMIVARILDPASKLATARGLHSDTLHSSLGELLMWIQPMSPNSTKPWTGCSHISVASSRNSLNAISVMAVWCSTI